LTDKSEDLQPWRLPRGRHGLPREVVVRSQQERLLAAVVSVTADKGYAAMSVADILNQAGVGRQSFYQLFTDKGDCLLAAHALLVDDLAEAARTAFEASGPWPTQVRAALGPAARERFFTSFHRFTKMLDDGLKEVGAPTDMPNLTSIAAATVLVRIYEETVRNQTAELPDLLPELTFELLLPFIGEDAARTAASSD
jgi:AcrR family transcriptional regulator